MAVLALDDQPADARRAQQRLVDLQVGRGPRGRPAARPRSAARPRRPRCGRRARGRVGGVAAERVDRLVVHPLTVPNSRGVRMCRWPARPVRRGGSPRSMGTMRRRAAVAGRGTSLGHRSWSRGFGTSPAGGHRLGCHCPIRPAPPGAARPDLRRRAAAARRVGRRAEPGQHRHAADPERSSCPSRCCPARWTRSPRPGWRSPWPARAASACCTATCRSRTRRTQVDLVKRSEAGMVTNPVTCSAPTTPSREVDALCGRYRISGVPVVDGDGMLVGIVTNRDMRFVTDPATPGPRRHDARCRWSPRRSGSARTTRSRCCASTRSRSCRSSTTPAGCAA